MPPKKEGPSKKTEQKKAAKIVDDKTFGLKNKNKSKTVQQFVKAVSNQVINQGKGTLEKCMAEEHEKRKAQKAEEERRALMASIFKTVDTVKSFKKTGDGEETAVKICQFFKQGLCNKGKKCKLSHDIVKDTQKIDIYTDQRQQFDDEEEELTSEKLNEIIKQKEGQYKKQCATEIVCKYFLDAVEKGKYGWKWMCPNGGYECHYRHCLPPGFVLKKDMKKEDEKDKLKIEDVIDEQREGFVRSSGTPVTLERFLEWKKKRAEKKILDEEKKKEDLAKKNKGQKKMAGLTGRALFVYDPTLFQDDADAVDDVIMENREEEEVQNQNAEDEEEEKEAQEQRRLLEEQEQNYQEEEEQEEEEEEQEEEQKNQQEEQQQQEEQKPAVDPKNNNNNQKQKYIHIDEGEF